MSWTMAMINARARAIVTGQRWYVRGYRTTLGRWRYGMYREPRPNIGRTWAR